VKKSIEHSTRAVGKAKPHWISPLPSEIRRQLQSAVEKGKSLGLSNGTLLLEFFHALDRADGIDPITYL
jgi:hypothetical protein